MRTFSARYPGTCHDCGEPIAPGDEVTYLEDSLMHAQCPIPRPVTVCPVCHLTKPCDCD